MLADLFFSFGSITGIILFSIYLIALSFLIYKWKLFDLDGVTKKWVLSAFWIKVFVSFLFWAFYFYLSERKEADIFKYFDDSAVIYSALKNNPADFFKMLFEIGDQKILHYKYYDKTYHWYRSIPTLLPNDNRTIIKFNAVVRIISYNCYHVHSLIANFATFIGTILIFKTFRKYFDTTLFLFCSLIFIPTVLFWSSGVLKENFLILNTGVFLYSSFKLKNVFSFKHLVLLILSCWVFLFLKVYSLFAFLSSLLIFFTCRFKKPKQIFLYYIAILLSLILIIVIIGQLIPELNFFKIIEKQQRIFIRYSDFLNSGSRFEVSKLEPNLWSFIKIAPEALLNTIVRPFLWDSKTLFAIVNSIETLCILLFAIFCTIYRKKEKLDWNFVLFLTTIWLIIYLIIGYTTPVWGAISRYKIAGLPFFVLTFLYLLDWKKVTSKYF